ncbi:MAG: DUF975 family protein [Clostridiaceae bacterium]|nr:DUF975 family protein [Clostridiaceae bacterium]
MWNYKEIRRLARDRMNLDLSGVLLAGLVFILISGALPAAQYIVSTVMQIIIRRGGDSLYSDGGMQLVSMMTTYQLLSAVLSIMIILSTIFIINPLYVGLIRFISDLGPAGSPKHKPTGDLFWTFKKERYSGVLAGTAWKFLWTSLWRMLTSFILYVPIIFITISLIINFSMHFYQSDRGIDSEQFLFLFVERFFTSVLVLLVCYVFIIPVVVFIQMNRAYAYKFCDFILSENPGMRASDALDQAKQMSKGIKGDMFLLDMTFFGWGLLSASTFGLLEIWLTPYRSAAFLEVYNHRKAEFRS